MTVSPAPASSGARFPQLLRTESYRWWRPILGLLVAGGVLLGGGVAVVLGVSLALAAAGVDDPFGAEALSPEQPAGLLANNLLLGLLIPASVLAVRLVHRQHPGLLLSVVGQLRWSLLLRFLAVALVVIVVFFVAGFLLPAEEAAPADSSSDQGRSVSVVTALLLVILVTTPLQAAAEEVGFRGYVTQVVGSYIRRPAVSAFMAAAVSGLLFALAHGSQDAWLFSDRLVFGLTASWLVWRTGGLEAAIALHVVNNLVTLVFTTLTGSLGDALEVSTLAWEYAVLDIAMIVTYAIVADRLARRWAVADRRPPASLALETPGAVGYPGPRTSAPPPAGGEHPWGMG